MFRSRRMQGSTGTGRHHQQATEPPKVRAIEVRGINFDEKLRARHYELWFSAGSIELEGASSSSYSAAQTALGDVAVKNFAPPDPPNWQFEIAQAPEPANFSQGSATLAMTYHRVGPGYSAQGHWIVRNPLSRPVRVGYSNTGDSKSDTSLVIEGSCNGITLGPGEKCTLDVRFETLELSRSGRFRWRVYLHDLDEPKGDLPGSRDCRRISRLPPPRPGAEISCCAPPG